MGIDNILDQIELTHSALVYIRDNCRTTRKSTPTTSLVFKPAAFQSSTAFSWTTASFRSVPRLATCTRVWWPITTPALFARTSVLWNCLPFELRMYLLKETASFFHNLK